jgi:hypothetical protein
MAVMNEYAVLTNRKRAIIALIHSFFFLLVALMGFASPPMLALSIRIHAAFASAVAMLAIYGIVTTILLVLTKVSRSSLERLYFGFCSTSAGVGLLRIVLGDPPMHLAVLVRVAMLSCAVVTGLVILREHSQPRLAE